MSDNLPPLPNAFATLHHDDGYFTMPTREDNMGKVFRTNAYTAEQMKAYARAALAQAQSLPDGWELVPVEQTPEIVSAMMKSQARDDEGSFPMLMDHIDYSGENKTRTVVKAAYKAALAASPAQPVQINCWCESCDLAQGHPLGRTRMSVCPQCGDKRCPRAKHHDSACQAAQPVQPSDPWLPIETAPKDGTRVLLRSNNGRHADSYWQERNTFTGPAYWVWPFVKCEPNHWMTLPPEPKPKD